MSLDAANYTTIAIEKRPNGVAVATLNRPERLNAVNGDMHHELAHICRDTDADPEVKVLVSTGAGRAFCAGGDFSPGSETTHKITLEDARMIVDHLLEAHIPIISAVNGYAMGLGATIALLCDIVVAGDSAVFADTHVKMGIGTGDGGQVIWPFLMGVNRAKYFLMTGHRLDAAEAERMGLVNFVVPDDELMSKALEIAASKAPINNWLRTVSAQVLPLSLSMEGATMRSADAKEAAKAFGEKRTPEFRAADQQHPVCRPLIAGRYPDKPIGGCYGLDSEGLGEPMIRREAMTINRLIALLLALAMLASACGSDDEGEAGSDETLAADADDESDEDAESTTTTVADLSGDSDPDWCGRMRSITESDEESPLSFSFLGLTPDELKEQFETNLEVVEEWGEVAPSEIDADVDLVLGAYRTFVEKGNEADWDFLGMSGDPAFTEAFEDDEFDAVGARIDAYSEQVCGVDMSEAATAATTPTVDEDSDLVSQLLSALGLPTTLIGGTGRECMNDALEASGAFSEPIGPGYVPGPQQLDALTNAAEDCGIPGLS